MLGLQAGILQGRTIGEDTVVGAHSLVIENIPALRVAMGIPCRVTRSREWGEDYY
jgi:acetyltransferase-like isoleucine patch superfamily enzyme